MAVAVPWRPPCLNEYSPYEHAQMLWCWLLAGGTFCVAWTAIWDELRCHVGVSIMPFYGLSVYFRRGVPGGATLGYRRRPAGSRGGAGGLALLSSDLWLPTAAARPPGAAPLPHCGASFYKSVFLTKFCGTVHCVSKSSGRHQQTPVISHRV